MTLIGNDAVKLIDQQDGKKPFFLYFASLAPHAPYQAPQAYKDRYPGIKDKNRQAYAGMISALDDQVGRIVAELEKKHLRDNTLILFASDNGGATSGLFASGSKSKEERDNEEGGIEQGAKAPASNAPLRGGKGSLYEGGVRVDAFVNWPGHLKPADRHRTAAYGGCHADAAGAWPAAREARTIRSTARISGTTLTSGAPSPNEDILVNVEAFRGRSARATGS